MPCASFWPDRDDGRESERGLMMLTDRFVAAVSFAAHVHAAQVRKGTNVPYVSHPLGVASLVLEFGGDEDQAVAALLHDVLEDGGPAYGAEIAERFGARVLGIVQDCTDGDAGQVRDAGNWRSRKEAYLSILAHKSDDALLVSACDKLHNARAIARDHTRLGEAIFERFSGGADGTRWYYGALLAVFQVRMPDSDLVCELEAAVARFADQAQA